MITFEEAGLNPEILKAITELGFLTPTPVQAQTLPLLLEGEKDVIALAQTGTGKTAAFALPLVQKTDVESRDVQTLVLCPTRELCLQIAKDTTNFAKYVKNFRTVAVYGGAPIHNQIKDLNRGAHLVVGTPGRTLDLIKRGVLDLSHIRFVVLDESDEMLNMGFKEDLDNILSSTPAEKQTLLFSATMSREVERIAGNFMKNPERVSIGTKNSGAEDVSHEYYVVHAKDRYKALKRIADVNTNIYGIVFCRTRMETKEVADRLIADGYSADALHGDLSQAQRDYVMGRFRNKSLQMLVATDVAARGIDINELTHVINFNLPDDLEVYIHRSGRTGRAGNKGVSIAIIHMKETGKIKALERMSKKTFERKLVPTGIEICERQLFKLVEGVQNVHVNEEQIAQFMPAIYKQLEDLSREQLIQQFVSVEFNRFLSYYENAPDLNVTKGSEREDREGKERRGKDGFTRFFINKGSLDQLNPAQLIGMINDIINNRNSEIGRIDIMKKFSFFEVEKGYEDVILAGFAAMPIAGMPTSVEISLPDPNKPTGGGGGGGFRKSSGGRDRDSGFKKTYPPRSGGGSSSGRRDDKPRYGSSSDKPRYGSGGGSSSGSKPRYGDDNKEGGRRKSRY